MIRTALALLTLAASAHAQATVSGTVFEDSNGNGVRDPGERGVPNVVVSNQDVVERTDAAGYFRITRGPTGIVFVSVPDRFRIVGAFWHPADAPNADFALKPARATTSFTFIHASDTHISPASVARTRRFRAMADSVNPAFVIITGDLVRDALRVNEAEATSYYDLFLRAKSPNSGMPCGPFRAITRTSASSARSRRWRRRIPCTGARCTGIIADRTTTPSHTAASISSD